MRISLLGAAILLGATIGWSADRQLSGHVPSAVSKLQPIGRLPASTNMHLAIGLPLQNPEGLSNLLQQIYDPASPNYRHYLTPAQFTEQFGPSVQDYKTLIAFAASNNLTVTTTHPNRMLLDVSGAAADVEKAFQIKMQVYQHPTENRNFFAPDVEPRVPAGLRIQDISGLNNYKMPHPNIKFNPSPKHMPYFGSGPFGNYLGNDFRKAYAPGVSLTGAGQTVGLFQFDGYDPADITAYENLAGLPNVPLQNILLDGYSGLPTGNGGEVEVSLDIEMVISMAPGLSQVIVYEAGPFGFENDILNRMATDDAAKQLSSSWGWGGGPKATTDQIFQQIAAQGQTFFNASGDSDALITGEFDNPNLPHAPSDNPFITVVGGTTLTTSNADGSWVSETVWNAGGGSGSTGGISSFYSIPTWQQGIDMTANKGSASSRNAPDVALTGDNVYVIADSGVPQPGTGGTSVASPLWAGFTALINQQAASVGQPSVGFLNPAIYAIGRGTNYALAFHDVTTGDNTSPTSPTLFPAVPGYDLCTGWGTPNGSNLINALVSPIPIPNLAVLTNVITGGNGNGVVDSDECNLLSIVLTNIGAVDATHVQTTVKTATSGVALVGHSSLYPDIPIGGFATNLTQFKISTVSNFVCGTPIDLTVVVKSDQVTETNSIRLATGAPGIPLRFDNSSIISIPDFPTNGVSSPIFVSGVNSALQKVTVSLNIVHPFDADLTLQLIAPDATSIILCRNIGFGANFGNSCSPDASRTTFDDTALTTITSANPPFVGTFQPIQLLSTFNGKSGSAVNGIWQLRVVDGAPLDVGFIDCWSLMLTPTTCSDGGGPCPGVDLAVGMTSFPSPDFVQNNLTYTISVTNNGPNLAKGVVVNQSLPGSVTFVSGNSSQGNVIVGGGLVTANLGSMDVNATATITVVVRPNSPGIIFSTANVGSVDNDFDPSNNTITIGSQINPLSADLAVGLTATPAPVVLGGVMTYTVSVTNEGPTTASNVVVTNTLPANVSFVSASSSQGTVNLNNGRLIASLGTMTVGTVATATIQVRGIIVGGITATSVAASDVTDPIPGNNTASFTTAVAPASDLTLSMVGNPTSAILGQNVVYTLIANNQGPSAASTLTVSDTLPPGLTYITSSTTLGSSSVVGGVVTFNMTNLPAGGSVIITITAGTASISTNQVPLVVTNNAVVFSPQADPVLANNTASAATRIDIARPAIIAAGSLLTGESILPTNGFIDPGETVTASFRLQNIGNLNTTNLVATLIAGGGVITNSLQIQFYGSLAAGGLPIARPFSFTATGTNGGTVTATLQLQDGPSNLGTVQFVYVLPTTSAFTNSADLFIPDHGPATPSYPSVINVSGVTGLIDRITVTLTNFNHTFPDDVDMLLTGPAGQTVLLMAHAGDSAVSNVSLTFDDTAALNLPHTGQIASGTYKPSQYGAVGFPAGTPAAPYGANLSTFNGTNANGNWSLYVFDSSAGDQGAIFGGWSIAITAGTPVSQSEDIAITGTANPLSVLAGANLTYTFAITNNGLNTANSVTFTDPLPTNVSFVSAVSTLGNCTVNGSGVISCPFGGLNVGTNVIITVVVTTQGSGTVTNTATVTTVDSDLNQSNNSATVLTAVNAPSADVSVGISSAPNPAATGNNLVYTIGVTNNGPGTALGVLVTDPIGSAAFVSGFSSPAVGIASNNAGTVTCNVGDLAAGASATVTLIVSPTQTGLLTNVVTASTLSVDTHPTNNTASTVVNVLSPSPNIIAGGAILLIESMTPTNGTIDPGETVSLSLALTNSGTANTSHLVATLLPIGGVVSPSGAQTYGSLIHGGPAISSVFSFTASGTNGGTIAATLQLQDGTTNLGNAVFVFNLPATTTFGNATSIIIPDSGPATPYPSTISISGVAGVVGNLTVTVSNITHAFPNDVQMLVQGPSGRKTLLMAGAGGAHSLTNVTLTFDDSAETTLPASAEIITGTFKPTDFVSVTFPSPAPVGPYGTSLAAFDGTNPNGTWSLFVFDNSPGDSGNIAGGWSLNITSINPIDNPFESTLKAVSYSNGTLGFTLNGQPGHIYVIQASTDLINWSPIGTNTISGSGTFQFTDGNAGSFPYRYYRAALIGP